MRPGDPPDAQATAGASETPVTETEEQARARRRAEREAEGQRRAAAVAFNFELGVAVVKTFAKVKLDDRVLQVLTAAEFKDDLAALAARGALRLPELADPDHHARRQDQDQLPRAPPVPRSRPTTTSPAPPTRAEIAGRCLPSS